MYRVIILPRVEKDIRKLDRTLKNRIVEATLSLQAEPRPHGCLKIKGEDGVWRIRVGDYRIGYEIDDDNRVVRIVRVANRSEFYS